MAAGFAQACGLVAEDYTGTIVRDGWAPYRRYEHASHQTCAAHVLRRCHDLADGLLAWAAGTPRQVRDLLKDALAARDLNDDDRAEAGKDLAERIDLLTAQAQPHDECRKLVAHLANERDALLTFLANPNVDATNWRGEQAIRPAVVNRKDLGRQPHLERRRHPRPHHERPAHRATARHRRHRLPHRARPSAQPHSHPPAPGLTPIELGDKTGC